MNFIIDNFNMLFDSEEGLKKLDEMILDLAVKGKLVPQDLTDEPASVLFEKIKEEKERLIVNKKIKKPKKLEPISEEKIPFEIPENWEWVRLGEIGTWGSGATPSRGKLEYYKNGIIPWLKTGELNNGFIDSSKEHITELALKKTSVRLNNPGDILIAMYGATIGKLGILNIQATTNQACCACTVFNGIYNLYLFNYLKSQKQNFVNQGVGGAQPNISKQKITEYIFPLPPLAEQKRIVEKIDSLKKLVEDLRTQIQIREKTRHGLKKSIMAEIEKSSDNKDLLKNLELIFQNFDIVVNKKEDIKDIRNLVLSMAVKGKLVEQDPIDEPARVLIKKMEEEKIKLIAEKKIKKPKELGGISEEEIPFELPKSWELTQIDKLTLKVTDGEHSTPKRTDKGFYLLSARNIHNDFIKLDKVDYVNESEFIRISKRCDPKIGDVLLSCSGSVGRVALVDKDKAYVMVRSAAMIRPFNQYVYNRFLMYTIMSPFLQKQIEKKSKATAQANLFLGAIRSLEIPFPPLAEQKRIVERVDQLMVLCDKLEEQVDKVQKEMKGLLRNLIIKEGVNKR